MLILIVDENSAGSNVAEDLAKNRPGVTVLKSPEARGRPRDAQSAPGEGHQSTGAGGDGSNVVAFRQPTAPTGPTAGLTEIVEEVEARLVHEAMARTGNNQIRAAELLQITRGALQYKLKKYAKPQAA